MPKDPWTDPDPQPGDFDEIVRTMDPRDIEVHEGNPNAKVTIVANDEVEDTKRLQQIIPDWVYKLFRHKNTPVVR